MMKNEMLRKIENREIVVGVVGLGYVGLPLAVEKAKAGFKTIGFDVQAQKVEMVNAGHNYIGDVVDSDLARHRQERHAFRHHRLQLCQGCRLCRHLRAHPAGRASAAGHQLCPRFRQPRFPNT